jgi:hypothetical protein
VERCIELRSKDALKPLGRQALEDAVVERAGRMHHSGERMPGGNGAEQGF